MTDFGREVDSKVTGALNPGERVIWIGHCLSRVGKQQKAGPALGARASVLALTLAAIVGLPICVLTKSPVFAIILGFAAFAVTAYVASSIFAAGVKDHAMYCRKQTAYVLTDRRAIVLRNCRTAYPVQSLLWAYVDEVRAESVGADGRGTVKFLHWDPMARRWDTPLQFYKVGAAFRVAEWAQAAMAQAKR
jgi:hypothetical protein